MPRKHIILLRDFDQEEQIRRYQRAEPITGCTVEIKDDRPEGCKMIVVSGTDQQMQDLATYIGAGLGDDALHPHAPP